MASSDHNLKSQLSDLQKRLSQSTINTPKRPGARKENDQLSTGEASDSRGGEPSKKSLSNFLGKKEKRISLPVFDSSSSRSLSTPTKGNGKDMDFVVGLSENLLLECRKLQAENQSKSNKLRTFEDELEKLKASNAALMSKVNESVQNEEKYKDTNWELELKLQLVQQDFKTVTDNYNKIQSELNKQLELSHDMRSELDEMNLNKDTLEKEYSSNKVTSTNQVQDLKAHIDELNDENYKLNDEIDELRKQLEESSKKPTEPQLKNVPILQPVDDESSDEEYKEPPISPVKTIPINNTALETETLRGSLSQAHHTIAKLRAQILKLRANEISNKQGSPAVTKKNQTPQLKKSIRSLNEPGNRSFHILKPSSNRSSKNIYEDSMDTTDYDDWENFEGDTTSSQFVGASSPTTKHSRPISTSQDLIEDSESDIDESELQGIAPLSSELKVLNENDVKEYAEQHGLVLVPTEEYQKLSKSDPVDRGVITPAQDFGFVALPNDDAKAKETFTESEFYSHANERGLVVLTKDEAESAEKKLVSLQSQVSEGEKVRAQYVEEAAQYRKQLENALSNVKSGADESKSLKEQLANPSKDFITEKASTHGLHVLPIADFQELQGQLTHFRSSYEDPSHDYLHERATSKNLKLLGEDDHSGLLQQIEDLRREIQSKQAEVEEIRNHSTEHANTTKVREADLQKTIEDLKSKVDELKKENEGHLTQIASLSESSSTLQKSLDAPSLDFITEKAKAHGHKVIHTEEHDRQLSEFDSSTTKLKATVDELNSKIKDLETDLEQKSSKIVELNTEVEKLKTKLTDESSSVKELTEKNSVLQKSIDEPEDDYIRQKASLRGFTVLEVAVYEKELADLSQTADSLRSELTSEKEKFGKQSEISKKLIDSLKEKVEGLQSERSELTKNVSELTQQLEHANGNLAILKSQVDNPSHEYLSEKSSKQGLTVLPKLAHVSLLERANKSIHDLAKEEKSVVLSENDHRELTSKVHEPTLEHLTSKAELHKHKVVPVDEFEELTKKANTPIEEAATAKGLVVLSKDDHDDIQSRLEEPAFDTLTQHLQTHQHVAIPEDEHKSLLEKSSRTVESLAEEKGLVLLPQEEHAELIRKAQTPTLDEVRDAASPHGHVLVDKEEHEALVTKANKSIKELAEESDHVVLTKSEHSELDRKVKSPTAAEIASAAAAAGFIAIHNNDHADLTSKASRSVHDLAKEENLVVLHPDEHKELISSIESPSVEYLTSKSAAAGHKIIKDEEHAELVQRANLTIDDHAKAGNLKVLSENEYESLINPSEDIVSKNAKKLGLVAVHKEDHDKVVAQAQAPTLDHITEKASALGYNVIDANDHQALLKTAEAPSKEFIRSKATDHGLIAVPEVDYTSLKEENSKLKKDFANTKLLAEKVSSDGSVVLKQEDYDELVEKANTSLEDLAKAEGKVVVTTDEYGSLLAPSKDTITDHAAKYDLVAIPKETHHELLRNHESPTVEHLSSKASAHGHVVVPKDHYEEVKGTFESPTSAFLTEKARDLNSVLIPIEVHEALEHKANKTIEDHAKELKKVIVDEEEYDQLTNPSAEKIKGHAERVGLVTAPKEEHDELTRTVQSPPLDFLHNKAADHSHVLLHEDELKELQDHKESPSVEFLSSKAAEHGKVVVSKDEFDSLKTHSEKPIETIAAERGLVALSEAEHNSLKNPTRETLATHADSNDLVLVESAKYQELLNPSKDALAGYAAERQLTLLSNESFEELKAKSERSVEILAEESGKVLLFESDYNALLHPAKETIISQASEQELVALPQEEFEKLSHPSVEYLKEHSDTYGLVLVPKEELDTIKERSAKSIDDLAKESNSVVLSSDLHEKLTNPEKESIIEHAAKHGLVTLTSEDHKTLLHPSKEVLSVHADREGLKLVTAEDYSALVTPSKESIIQKAEDSGLIAIEKSEYDALHSSANAPSVEHITEKASDLGLKVLPLQEHEELSRSIAEPSKEFIQAGAAKHKLVTVGESEKAKFVQEYLGEHNLVSLDSDDFAKLKDVSEAELPDLSSRLDQLGHVAVEKSDYEKLSADITKEEVINLASGFGLKAVPSEQYLKLVNGPTEDELKPIAEFYNLALLPRSELDLLRAQTEQPDKEVLTSHAGKLGCVLVAQKEYESLQNSSKKVSKSDLESKAKKINHVLIPQDEYDQFVKASQTKLQAPSTPVSKYAASKDYFENISKSGEKDNQKAKVFESARTLGFVPVAADEYKHLLEHQKDHVITKSDIYKGAKDFNLAILPVDEYKGLLKNRSKTENLTYDDLEALAKRFNLVLTKPSEGFSSSRSIQPFTLHTNESSATFSSSATEGEFTDALERVPSNASTIRTVREASESLVSEEELRTQAKSLGFELVPLSEVSTSEEAAPELANDNDSIVDEDHQNDTITERELAGKDDVIKRAGDLGLIVLEENEYDSLKVKELNQEELEVKAEELGLKMLPYNDYESLEALKSPNEDYIREVSKSLGLILLSDTEVKEVQQKAIDNISPTELINEENIHDFANNNGLIVLTRDRFDGLVESSKITKDLIVERAGEFGLVAIEVQEYESLKSKVSSGNGLGKEAILAGASALGLSVLSSHELASRETKPAAHTKETIAKEADALGLTVVNQGDYEQLVAKSNKTISERDVLNYSTENGLAVITAEQLKALEEKENTQLTREAIVAKGEEFGLISLPITEYQQLRASADSNAGLLLSKSDVVAKATEFDLVAVSKEEIEALRSRAAIRSKEDQEKPKSEPPVLSREELEAGARLHGLLAIPENSFIATNISRIPDVNNVVVLPVTYYNKLTKAESMSLDKISNDELQAQARKRGFHITYGEVDFNRDIPPLTRKNTVTSLTSSNSRKNLAEAAASAAYQEYENQPKIPSRSSSRARSIARSGSNATIHQRDVSIDGGISLVTNASLSEPNIIPALTQTVIGEYLYKYYRRLGPLSSISESRHERYFWIHPYTLTLYWSSTNPVLGNPSSHKTRAAAIIGVESIEDNNPLPAGLYHKSIIVHSQTRSIKITCPTRQRHNIWFNSLRYLIQRTMDGINLEDDLDLLKDNGSKHA